MFKFVTLSVTTWKASKIVRHENRAAVGRDCRARKQSQFCSESVCSSFDWYSIEIMKVLIDYDSVMATYFALIERVTPLEFQLVKNVRF